MKEWLLLQKVAVRLTGASAGCLFPPNSCTGKSGEMQENQQSLQRPCRCRLFNQGGDKQEGPWLRCVVDQTDEFGRRGYSICLHSEQQD